jgi:hypothetical protein
METDREFSFVGLLSLAQLISRGALYYSFAIVSVPIERDLGWDRATVNGAWSIGLLFTGLAAFPVGIFLDRLGGRIIMTGGTLLGVVVRMIDTSIVRVHQHGACITRNQRQSMGRSRGGLTSKIHALVDSNGLPVRLALSPGEAHDVRLAGKLLSRLKPGSMLLADRGYDAD